MHDTGEKKEDKLEPGLYFVAVPLGNARDITLRAIDILTHADILLAEDTRSLRRLLSIHNIALKGRRISSYNDYNGAGKRPYIITQLTAKKSVAYAPEAGTPMIADPGFALARQAEASGCNVYHAPGPSAVIMALCASGFGTDQLYFAGFAPLRETARIRYLEKVKTVNATTVIYESPRRVEKLLAAIITVFGENHQIALCRELTKKFETVLRAKAGEIYKIISENSVKGECVLVIERTDTPKDITENDVKRELEKALLSESLPNAAKLIAKRYNIARTNLYKLALEIKKQNE